MNIIPFLSQLEKNIHILGGKLYIFLAPLAILEKIMPISYKATSGRAIIHWVTTSGGVRSLANAKKSASRSQTSIHYTGLAFDLGMWTGMYDGRINAKVKVDATKQPYVIERVGTRNWHVWCKTENPNVPVRKIKAYIFPHKQVVVEGRFFSFTDLASKYGFTGIGERSKFKSTYACAEWWHFNYLVPLVRGRDTFASILEELWSDKQLQGFAGHSKFGARVWGEGWRG